MRYWKFLALTTMIAALLSIPSSARAQVSINIYAAERDETCKTDHCKVRVARRQSPKNHGGRKFVRESANLGGAYLSGPAQPRSPFSSLF
jgi:hypothetical protein